MTKPLEDLDLLFKLGKDFAPVELEVWDDVGYVHRERICEYVHGGTYPWISSEGHEWRHACEILPKSTQPMTIGEAIVWCRRNEAEMVRRWCDGAMIINLGFDPDTADPLKWGYILHKDLASGQPITADMYHEFPMVEVSE